MVILWVGCNFINNTKVLYDVRNFYRQALQEDSAETIQKLVR
jgi:hypothetical protein